jgi:hypothetical protein
VEVSVGQDPTMAVAAVKTLTPFNKAILSVPLPPASATAPMKTSLATTTSPTQTKSGLARTYAFRVETVVVGVVALAALLAT